jgi:hypothetical protein
MLQPTCLQCNQQFLITDEDLIFYDKVSPVFNGQKHQIPPPQLCPDCRQQRRLAWRNERKLYQRKCDLCQKEIVSIYPANTEFPVYCSDCWWSDNWDPLEYGQDFDFNKSFFEQFEELQKIVPRLFMFETNNENSKYTNGSAYNNNCYLIFVSDHNQNTNYSYSVYNCRDCSDLMASKNCELCYECIGCENSYELTHSQNSNNCSSSQYLNNCRTCSNCSFCVGLRQKKFHIFNQSYSKEEYYKQIKIFNTTQGLNLAKQKFQKLIQKSAYIYLSGINNENVTGDFIFNSKNTINCYESHNLENCSNIIHGNNANNCYDGYVIVDNSELLIDNISIISLYQGGYNYCIWHGENVWYSDTGSNVSKIFGCISLKKAKYCILNKQYTKKEYEELVPRIIEHMRNTSASNPPSPPYQEGITNEWGEFFPVELSPFAYNETVAQEYFPMTKEEVLAKGWKWREEEDKIPDVKKIIPAEKLPDDIGDIPDDILNWAIKCEKTGRPFKIQKPELEFYRKMNLPIPHFHPDVRHEMRMAKRNPRKLWTRPCAECGIEMQTTYAPDRPERVLCENCYLKEVN